MPDDVFNVETVNTRRVEPRNTPTNINAVFNFANFWDGRAHNTFNGESVVGPLDQNAKILVNDGGTLQEQTFAVTNSSLASQAVGPPVSRDGNVLPRPALPGYWEEDGASPTAQGPTGPSPG